MIRIWQENRDHQVPDGEGPWANGFGKMMVIEEKEEEDSQIPASVRTMTELKKMANSIHPMHYRLRGSIGKKKLFFF